MVRKADSKIRNFAVSELLSVGLSLLPTVFVAAVDTNMFSAPPRAFFLVRWLAAFAMTRWIVAMIEMWRAYPERAVQKALEENHHRHPGIKNLAYERFWRAIDRIAQEMANLTSDAGEAWQPWDRLQTANDVCDGLPRITKYVATTTDAPYLPPSETKEFYQRQAKKLPRKSARRLLVYDFEKLLSDLNSPERFDNLKAFHRLHLDHGLQLRYWPYSLKKLEERLKVIVGVSSPLVDFGIINDELVFGQSLNSSDENRVSGRGRISIVPGEVSRYVAAFESLWAETAKECFPGSQLDIIAKLMEMRYRQKDIEGESGKTFFDKVIARIKDPKNGCLVAIDIAPDMGVWWREVAYQRFLKATIDAAKAGHSCSRVFVFRRRFGTSTEAKTFVDDVVKPQIDAGAEVGMVFVESTLEHDVGIADFILDGGEWGFYLVPGDVFHEAHLSERNNIVINQMHTDLKCVHNDVRTLASRCGKLLGRDYTLDTNDLVAWLHGL